jgi:(2Fe-2S) ferredoxin
MASADKATDNSSAAAGECAWEDPRIGAIVGAVAFLLKGASLLPMYVSGQKRAGGSRQPMLAGSACREFSIDKNRFACRGGAVGSALAGDATAYTCVCRTGRGSSRMSYFQRHVFFCLNERAPPDACCANHKSAQMHAYAKDRVKKLGISGAGKIRINKAGCLDRCDEGPCVVVYPEAVWYTYADRHDIDEIIDTHLVGGKLVTRLLLP